MDSAQAYLDQVHKKFVELFTTIIDGSHLDHWLSNYYSLCYLAQDFPGEGKQSQMAGAFDGAGQGALVFGTGTSLAARANLAVIRNKTPEYFGLFVVNYGVLIRAELAFARAGEEAPWPAAGIRKRLVAHDITPRDRA
jgi:hypothetical protein